MWPLDIYPNQLGPFGMQTLNKTVGLKYQEKSIKLVCRMQDWPCTEKTCVSVHPAVCCHRVWGEVIIVLSPLCTSGTSAEVCSGWLVSLVDSSDCNLLQRELVETVANVKRPQGQTCWQAEMTFDLRDLGQWCNFPSSLCRVSLNCNWE